MPHAVTYQRFIEVRKVTSRFPTGEVRTTEYVELAWVDEHAVPPKDFVYCPLSTEDAMKHPQTFRRKVV